MFNAASYSLAIERNAASDALSRRRFFGLAVVAIVTFLAATASARATEPAPVITSVLDTGPSSELVSSIPIYTKYESSDTKVIYLLPISSVKDGETLRATANVELTGSHSYGISVSVRLVLGSSPSDADGTVVTPWTTVTQTSEMSHLTLPISGVFNTTADLGTQYLKFEVEATSGGAKEGEILAVSPNSGSLAVTRYAPTPGPTSLPTDRLQAIAEPVSEQILTIPVDSGWRVVLSREASDLSAGDLLEIVAQLGVENPNSTAGTAVTLETRITRTTSATGTGGTWVAEPAVERLGSNRKYARIVEGNEAEPVVSPTSKYINLSVRAVPVEGSPKPLNIVAGSGALSVLRYMPDPGSVESPLLIGTDEVTGWDDVIDKSTVPFAAEGKSPVVVNSVALYDLRKWDIIRGQGLLAMDLNGGESAPVETELIVTGSKTATTGETLMPRTGDTVSTTQRVHTLFKEGTYVVPKTPVDGGARYLNLIAYANRAPSKSGEEMNVTNASVAFARSTPVGPFIADFEDGTLDQFINWGHMDSVTSNQAREGILSMQVDVDSTSWCPCDEGQDPGKEIRRAEVGPPNARAAGGYDGEDRWYGFSVYFPESFKVPIAESPQAAGTWNTFSQWHHTNAGLDCTTSLPPPIAFNARYWKANTHTNPGETKTATPVDGEYLEVAFNGSEITSVNGGECNKIVNPTHYYVLAPIERGHWYDFVLHATWTTEEGGPGNSVSEVWVNGEQVLGNQTNAVSMPTLFWHGSPAIHNTSVNWQFGLYRGPSKEDPAVRVFLDSFRAGSSYAEVAPETHAPRIEVESYDATLMGGGLSSFTTSKSSFDCEESALFGEMSDASRQLSLNAEYGKCTATASKFFSTVTMNGCRYNLGVRNAAPPYTGTLGVACDKEGEAIEYKAYLKSGGTLLCTAKVRAQSGLEGIGLSNSGEGAERGVDIAAEVKGVKYEYTGGASCPAEARTDGVLTGETTLSGADEAEEQVGVHLTGDEFLPRLEAESYAATLEGEGLKTFTTKAGSFECGEAVLTGVTGNATSQLSLNAEYGKCTATASKFFSTVTMNGCRYNLGVRNAAPPYTGTLGVACDKEGEAIEYKAYLSSGGTLICTAKVGPQSALEGLGLSNVGEGAERGVGVEAKVEGIKYELKGSACPKETRTDGVIAGKGTLLGADEDEGQIGAYLAGEP